MSGSYRSIDYSVRPAKHAERKMIAEALRRLSKFGSVESYTYVGFGSLWFADFTHFHRTLGIKNMYSIEGYAKHPIQQSRFEFNKPFGGIKMMFGSSATELPRIDWTSRTISWLDYDDPLTTSMLADVRTIAGAAAPGSALILSVQTQSRPLVKVPNDEDDGEKFVEAETIEKLKDGFGADKVPAEAVDGDLFGWKISKLVRQMLLKEIDDALAVRNATRTASQAMRFHQIISIEYADGAKMTTIGGVFADSGQRGIFESCGFQELDFYKDRGDVLRLEVPKITPKEMRDLETRLPIHDVELLDCGYVPPKDAKAYGKLYRYFPNFTTFEP